MSPGGVDEAVREGLGRAVRVERLTYGSGAANYAAALMGESHSGRNCPVAALTISSDEEGDQFIESLEVKVSVGRGKPGQIRQGRRTSEQVVAEANQEAPKYVSHGKRIVGGLRMPSVSDPREG